MKIQLLAYIILITTLKTIAQPTNDDCTSALSLTIGQTCVPLTFNTATATESMPACTGISADDDIWFKFTPADTLIQITVNGLNEFDPVVEVFDSCNGASIFCKDDNGPGDKEVIIDPFIIGQTYYIRVFDYDSIKTNNTQFTICTFYLRPPANDDCVNAISVSVDTACNNPITGTLYWATASASGNACSGSAEDDVWYKFVATDTNITIRIWGENSFNPVLELRNACNSSYIQCANNSLNTSEYMIAGGLTIGNTYHIRVFDNDITPTSNTEFNLCIHKTIPIPTHTICTSAKTIIQNSVCIVTQEDNFGVDVTHLGNECSGIANDNLWYKFIATTPYAIAEVTSSSGFDAVIEAFYSCNDTASYKCIDKYVAGEVEKLYLTNLIVGNTYFLRVYDYGSDEPITTMFDLCLYSIPPPPANDDCISAIQFYPHSTKSLCTYTTYVTTANATPSDENSIFCSQNDGAENDDVWFYFIANDTTISVSASGLSGINGVGMSLYAGACSGPEMNECTANASGDSLQFTQLTIGSYYYLRVYSTDITATGTFSICAYATTTGVGIDEQKNHFKIYPNPAENILFISSSESSDRLNNAEIEIYNSIGCKISKTEFIESMGKIDIRHLSEGIYFIHINAENKIYTFNFYKL